MGKGYNNYMTKKPFHPGSKANIKRTWMAEQRTENEKRKQEELKAQYDKEQDLYNNRALLSTESKDKLQLNFMYEAPPGAKRERQKEDDEPEYKFEWQRKYNAPREDYAKGNSEIRDQPFGIPVRNVRCIKCHKWGHINTDKECPLYTHASTSSMPTTAMDPLELMRQMREDGYDLKRSALGHQVNPKQANEQFIPSDNSDPEIDFLKSLSAKQKRKLLKKLNKLSKKHKADQKKKKGKKKSKKRMADSDSESEEESKKKKKQKKVKAQSSPSESESDITDEDEKQPILKEKRAKASSKIMKKSASSSLPSKHEENHKPTKKKHRTAEESDEKSNIIISQKSTATDKLKRTANDANTGKSKEEKKSSQVADSDRSKKDDSKKQNINLSEDSTTKQSTSTADNTRTKPNSCDSSSDTSDEKGQLKKNKRLKFVPSSDAQLFAKPHENLPSTSKASETLDDAKPLSKNEVTTHPDGFDPAFPQRTTPEGKNNPSKQDRALHDRYRDLHRHRRSPSVKHKYRDS